MSDKKFIVAYDTICTGWGCVQGENEEPVLYDSHDEALKEIFGDALASWDTKTDEDLLEDHEDITKENIQEMETVYKTGDVEKMNTYLVCNPEMNYNEEFVVAEEDYIQGRKAIFN